MNTRLVSVGTATPPHGASQEHAARFMSRVIEAFSKGRERDQALALIDRIYPSTGIRQRASVIEDYLHEDPGRFEFFPPRWDLEPFPTTERRMDIYETTSVELAERAAREALADSGLNPQEVSHLIITTCTGFFAPGPDVLIVERLGLKPTVSRFIIGFMGCHAGFNGMRLADQIVRGDPDAVVLQLSVELCTLHFQKKPEPDLIVANALFADGCAAATYGSSEAFTRGLADLLATRSKWEEGTKDHISWRIGTHGFEMRLAAEVPRTLSRSIVPFVGALLQSEGLSLQDVQRWALHPGGPKIIEKITGALDLEERATRESLEVLAEHGNMSSATVLYVLERILRQPAQDGPVVALGFGPGLSLEGAVFRTL